jgi:hypothetical protein
MKDIELVCATDYEEFFYKDSNEVVEEGVPVGIEWSDQRRSFNSRGFSLKDEGVSVHFDLFNNIYWSPKYDRE